MTAATLKGKTLFITGASRGIGKAIGVRAARDGARVVLFAKTTEPHPKLPGTLYTAAEEIREAGGEALVCVGDIRYEDQVQAAVDKAAERVTGTVRLKLYKGNVMVTGRKSPNSLYDEALVTFEEDQVYDQRDAQGFIRLNALRLMTLKRNEG